MRPFPHVTRYLFRGNRYLLIGLAAGVCSLQAAVLDGVADPTGKLDAKPKWNADFDDRTVSHLMIQAGQAFNQGDLRTSLKHLRAAKRRLPLSAEIKLSTAHILARLGEYDDALEEVITLLDSEPKNPGYLRLIGFCQEKLNKNDEAIETYERLSRVAKTSEKPFIYLGSVYFRIGNIDKAIASYQKATEINPNDAASLEALGSAWYQAERNDEAIDAYKRALAVDPEFAEAHNSLGTVYYATGEIEQAMLSVQRALNLDPRMARAYNNLAGMHALQKDPMTALELLTVALDLDLFSAEIWGNTFLALNEVIQKPADWKMPGPSDELEPKLLGAWHFREASKYTKGKDLLKAFQHLIAAIQADPGAGQYYDRVGMIITQSNFPTIGMHFFRMALALNPTNPSAQKNLQELVSFMSETRYKHAISSLQQAIKENPENASAHYQLAMMYAVNKNLSNAIPHLVRTVQIVPEHIPARISLSRSLRLVGEFDSAMETMLSSFAIDIRSFDAWIQLLESVRLMLPKLDDWEFPMPEATLKMSSEEYAAWHYRKSSQYKADDTNAWIKASQHLFEAILKDQVTSEYFVEMGLILDKHISTRLALPFFQLASEIAPESETIKQQVASSREKAYIEGLEARRVRLLQAIEQFPENPDSYVKLAILYAENNNVKLAMQELAKALKIDPKHGLARLTLARALHVTGQRTRSIEIMEQLLAEDTKNIFFKHQVAWLIMDSKDPISAGQLDRAFKLSKEACGAGTPETPPDFLRTLARIYHVKNEGRKAVQTAVQAIKAAQAKEQPALARTILEEAKTYKAAMTP